MRMPDGGWDEQELGGTECVWGGRESPFLVRSGDRRYDYIKERPATATLFARLRSRTTPATRPTVYNYQPLAVLLITLCRLSFVRRFLRRSSRHGHPPYRTIGQGLKD